MSNTDQTPTPFPPRGMRGWRHYVTNLAIRGLIGLALSLPYKTRVNGFGWLTRRIIGPLAGYRTRARRNLEMIYPDKSPQERLGIANACLENVGRTFIENYSATDFPARMASVNPTGPGLTALETASGEGRPTILVTGHYGNYEATRAALVSRGFNIGGLYRNMSNPYFNAHYVKTMEAFGGPVFPQGRKGTAGFVRHLKSGGQLVLLFDQHVFGAPEFDFLGQPALTATSAAELALRYNAELIPFYGIRQSDGLTFEAVLEAPIPHSTPEEMTQALNDSLAARIEEDPGQWFWVHKRWKSANHWKN